LAAGFVLISLNLCLEHDLLGWNRLRRGDFAAWAGFVAAACERAKRVAGTTGKPFDEPATQNPAALRVSRWRAPASLRRSTDVPASPFAPRLAAYAAAQLRSALYLTLPTEALAKAGGSPRQRETQTFSSQKIMLQGVALFAEAML
jgi:hypothetical protein